MHPFYTILPDQSSKVPTGEGLEMMGAGLGMVGEGSGMVEENNNDIILHCRCWKDPQTCLSSILFVTRALSLRHGSTRKLHSV